MTLGEKIKNARKEVGLSQEQLSEKLMVSRSAVAKWEAGKGLPDVDNLKQLSKLLNVSIDYLLSDEDDADMLVLREAYDLSAYGKGFKKARKDRLIKERFGGAEIYTLIGRQRLTKGEKVVDNALGFLTDAPYGIPEFINGIKNLDKEFYLINEGARHLFVTVTDEFIETRTLSKPITDKKFEIGGWRFIKCPFSPPKEKKND